MFGHHPAAFEEYRKWGWLIVVVEIWEYVKSKINFFTRVVVCVHNLCTSVNYMLYSGVLEVNMIYDYINFPYELFKAVGNPLPHQNGLGMCHPNQVVVVQVSIR